MQAGGCWQGPRVFYRYFRGRVDEYQLTMELAAERLVPHLMRFAVRKAPVAATPAEASAA